MAPLLPTQHAPSLHIAAADHDIETTFLDEGGILAIMEEVLLPVMYDIPSRDDVAKVVVTKETVQDNVLPTIVPRKPARNERRDKSA